MHREIHKWWSPSLGMDMPIAVYGTWGNAILMFPTAAADFLEYERFHMIDMIEPYIESGKFKVFSIDSINSESWFNNYLHPAHKAIRQQQYNNYIANEVIPFIHNHCHGRVLTVTFGISLGAFHAANTYFRRPDIFDGCIVLSGSFDLKRYTDGYFDDNCYFNSPVDYLANLDDEWYINKMRSSNHIHIFCGQGDYEDPGRSIQLANILRSKGIPVDLDLWGYDMRHDWPTWYKMFPYILDTRF